MTDKLSVLFWTFCVCLGGLLLLLHACSQKTNIYSIFFFFLENSYCVYFRKKDVFVFLHKLFTVHNVCGKNTQIPSWAGFQGCDSITYMTSFHLKKWKGAFSGEKKNYRKIKETSFLHQGTDFFFLIKTINRLLLVFFYNFSLLCLVWCLWLDVIILFRLVEECNHVFFPKIQPINIRLKRGGLGLVRATQHYVSLKVENLTALYNN